MSTVQTIGGLAAVLAAVLLPFIAVGLELGDRLKNRRYRRRVERAQEPRADARKIYELECELGIVERSPEGFREAYGYGIENGPRVPV